MKAASAGLDAHYQSETTSIATFWKLKTRAGGIITATSLDIDVDYDLVDGEGDGSQTYKASTGFNRSALENTADFKVGNMEIRGVLESTQITAEDIRAEIYDFAKVWIFQLNWKDKTQGELKLQRGYLGRISLRDELFVAEFRDLLDLFLSEVGEIVVEECPIDLFDGKCRVQQLPADWLPTTVYTATIEQGAEIGSYISADSQSAVLMEDGNEILLEDGSGILLLESANSNRLFRCTVGGTSDATIPAFDLTLGNLTVEAGGVTWEAMQANQNLVRVTGVSVARRVFTVEGVNLAMDAPDIHFEEGTVAFRDGPNAPLVNDDEIKTWDLSSGTVELWQPMPFDITVGETLLMFAGCTKTMARCVQFKNINNHRGWKNVPGTNAMVQGPTA